MAVGNVSIHSSLARSHHPLEIIPSEEFNMKLNRNANENYKGIFTLHRVFLIELRA